MNETKQKKEIVKRENYTMLDSGRNFFYVILLPLITALIFPFIVAIAARQLGITAQEVSNSLFMKAVSSSLIGLVFLCFILIYHYNERIHVFKANQIKFKGIKLNWVHAAKIGLVILLSFATVFLVSPFIGMLDHLYTFMGYKLADLPFAINNAGTYILGLLLLAVLPAVAEEILFRGVILNGLKEKMKPMGAILLSALMFSLMHGSLQQMVYQFGLGVLLGTVAYVTGHVVYAIILHFINNAIVVTAAFIQGGAAAPAKVWGAWDYILPIILLIVGLAVITAIVYCLHIIKKKKDQPTVVKATKKPELNVTERTYLVVGLTLGVVAWILGTLNGFGVL